jgi:hypothetical protein
MHQQDVIKLQNEINTVNLIMLAGVLIGVIMIFACFVAAEATGKTIFHEAALLLGVTVVFWVARSEVMIHRPVPYINMVQDANGNEARLALIPSWEKYLAKRNTRKLTFILDIAAGIAFFWIFIRAGKVMVGEGQAFWVWVYGGGIAAGIGAAMLLVYLARKGW